MWVIKAENVVSGDGNTAGKVRGNNRLASG